MAKRMLTIIDLPHRVLEQVGGLLTSKGFSVGTVGGGYAMMELEGTLTDQEKADLITTMAAIVFEFDEVEVEDDPGY